MLVTESLSSSPLSTHNSPNAAAVAIYLRVK